MGKLCKINNNFNFDKENLKQQFLAKFKDGTKTLSRAAKIGVLGLGLLGNTVGFNACKFPNTPTIDPVIEKESEEENGKDVDTASRTDSEADNTNNEDIINDNTDNNNTNNDDNSNTGNTTGDENTPEPEIEQPTTPTTPKYNTPTRTQISNGYVFANFIGESESYVELFGGDINFQPRQATIDAVNYYCDDANGYFNECANQIQNQSKEPKQSTASFARFAMASEQEVEQSIIQADINDLIEKVKNSNLYVNQYGTGIAEYYNDITERIAPIFKELSSQLKQSSKQDYYAFSDCYRLLANEAYKQGLGVDREVLTGANSAYQKEKRDVENNIQYDKKLKDINLEQEYSNGFIEITKALNEEITIAAELMGVNKEAIKEVVNLALGTEALFAMQTVVKGPIHSNEYYIKASEDDLSSDPITGAIELGW